MIKMKGFLKNGEPVLRSLSFAGCIIGSAAKASANNQRTGERTMPDLHGGKSGIGKSLLSTETKLFEDRGVAIELGALEVVEKLTTTCGHRDKTTA